MKILVVGGEGQVGKEFAAFTHQNVSALSRQTCDITHLNSVEASIEKYSPSIIVNTAAYTAVDLAETEIDLAYSINRDGVRNLALACRNADIPLIHLSTDYVFDGEKLSAYSEDDTTHPTNIYGKSKLAGEIALRAIWDKHIILRTSWVFGQYGKNFVKTILRLAKEREQLRIVADQHGCPTSARSITEVIINICEQINNGKAEWGTFHYCNVPATNWFAFAKEIVAEAKNHIDVKVKGIIPITTEDYQTAAKRPKNSVLNCQKIQQVFGIIPANWQTELNNLITKLK